MLQDFRSGDSETSSGGQLTDAAVVRLTTAYPNLIYASVAGTTHLSDVFLLAFFRNCLNLLYLEITGDDKLRESSKDPHSTSCERRKLGEGVEEDLPYGPTCV